MARIPRYLKVDDGSVLHITWQTHNKSWLLEEESMKQLYYDLLLKYKEEYGISIFSYSFMSTHPHLTVYCKTREGLSDFFRVVNSVFAKTYNMQHSRCGQVVMDRFKSPRIETDDDHLKVAIYGEFNQVRAGMVAHPNEWKWNSYAHYAGLRKDPLIDEAPFYTNLGSTPLERQEKYRELVDDLLWNECVRKQNFSAIHFIGNPIWVEEKIKEMRREILQKSVRRKKPPPT